MSKDAPFVEASFVDDVGKTGAIVGVAGVSSNAERAVIALQ
jgi:hypothetical protein